jgi:glycosyltransferase involved in cell wall biosynthesis
MANIAVLLSTYQGERYLKPQLDSLLAQSLAGWTLYWRDDGSTDASPAIMQAFAANLPAGRCVQVHQPAARAGAAASFLGLLRSAVAAGETTIAFADQDDVWLPDKLARAYAALETTGSTQPALYCARQILVDANLRRIGLSPVLADDPGFPASLTQNIAVGCTIMLNQRAARLIADSRAPAATLHDWWCYIVVSAAGGRVVIDEQPALLYRQHAGNLVGAPASRLRRALAALQRGPRAFMDIFRQHVTALASQPELLTSGARDDLARIEAGLRGGWRQRLRALTMRNLRRQTRAETLLFRLWFLLTPATRTPSVPAA